MFSILINPPILNYVSEVAIGRVPSVKTLSKKILEAFLPHIRVRLDCDDGRIQTHIRVRLDGNDGRIQIRVNIQTCGCISGARRICELRNATIVHKNAGRRHWGFCTMKIKKTFVYIK